MGEGDVLAIFTFVIKTVCLARLTFNIRLIALTAMPVL